MSGIIIRSKHGDFTGELDTSAVSDTIWLSLPRKFQTNMLGCMMYFECPIDVKVEGERVTQLKKGDIAYWPKVGALCFFYGPTPLSGEDKEPVAPFPVVKIGELTGEFDGLDNVGDRQTITIDRNF